MQTNDTHHLLNQYPGMVLWRDTDSNFILANDTYLRWTGCKNLNKYSGISYYDLPCPTAELADVFIEHDRIALSRTTPLKNIGLYCYLNDDWKVLYGERVPLRDEHQRIIGVASYFMDVTDNPMINFEYLHRLGSAKRVNGQCQYVLDEPANDYALTERQLECLFYLLRGYTAKMIAATIGISFRTVEGHIDKIKLQLGCHSKNQIIEKSYSLGLHAYMPKTALFHHK